MPTPDQNQSQMTGNPVPMSNVIHFEGNFDAQTGGIFYKVCEIRGSFGGLACLSAAITTEILNSYLNTFGNISAQDLCEKYIEDFLVPLMESIQERKGPSQLNVTRVTLDITGALKQAIEDKKQAEGENDNGQ